MKEWTKNVVKGAASTGGGSAGTATGNFIAGLATTTELVKAGTTTMTVTGILGNPVTIAVPLTNAIVTAPAWAPVAVIGGTIVGGATALWAANKVLNKVFDDE
ncbi:hypothetical protein H1P_870004 [Hyella patelloides LEGE 07179]|uniref:Uncharacterized protein n=1 Tax=Hyella patelloides LEGE 07179 TaxID=945734 RepID=A0A563W4T0_9CYAN|nr:hypothetical protein [Hyella patelloides]VEP18701.1 hypothetical protein H1P_870004 [Hyella patelloides LEGE 07179]